MMSIVFSLQCLLKALKYLKDFSDILKASLNFPSKFKKPKFETMAIKTNFNQVICKKHIVNTDATTSARDNNQLSYVNFLII